MKKTLFTKAIFSVLALTMLTTGTIAQGGENPNSFISKAEVKHIAANDQKSLIQVRLNNAEGERFTLTVKDEYGNIILKEQSSDKQFDRKYQFENLGDLGKLTFTLRSVKDNAVQQYEVDAQVRVVNEVVVSKL